MNDRAISYETKQHVYKRANGCCEYCLSQARYSTQSFSIDHIIPISKGGADSYENTQAVHYECNERKADS